MNTREYFCSRITLSRWAMALSGTISYQIKGTEQSIGHIFAHCQSRLSYKIIPNNFRVLLLLLVTHIDWWLVTIAEESPYLLSKVWWLILLVSLIDVLEKKVFLQICLWPCVLVIFLIVDLVPGFSPLGEMPLCHFLAFSSYSYIKKCLSNPWEHAINCYVLYCLSPETLAMGDYGIHDKYTDTHSVVLWKGEVF